MEILLAGNKSLRKKILLPKGEPENPATTEELEEKFNSCVDDIFSEQRKEEIVRTISKLEQLDHIQMLTKLLCPEKCA